MKVADSLGRQHVPTLQAAHVTQWNFQVQVSVIAIVYKSFVWKMVVLPRGFLILLMRETRSVLTLPQLTNQLSIAEDASGHTFR